MNGNFFAALEQHDHENVFICQDRTVGLRAIIAIHDTTLGPAAGGCRMLTYPDDLAAMADALRLARAMTYKFAAAGINMGGAKCVLIGDAKKDKSEALFRALGRHINRLGGLYITGEDVGTDDRDMAFIRMETRHVATAPPSWGGSGPLAPATAFGVVQSMRACLAALDGSDDLAGRSVAVQGVGAVGRLVVEHLVEAAARVVVSDIDMARVQELVARFGVQAVSPEQITGLDVDIFCPCALGGVINDDSVERLRCRIVAGSANNQLAAAHHGDRLHERGILYAPDYVANSGGAIAGTDPFLPGGYDHDRAMAAVARIKDQMARVLKIAREQNLPTYKAADVLAEQRLAAARSIKAIASEVRPPAP